MIETLRDLVTIQTPTDAVDSIGGQTVSWSTHASVYAQVKNIFKASAGGERFFRQMLVDKASHVVKIRYLSTVTPSMRVLFGSRTFQIRGVDHEEQNSRWTYLYCEEGTPS